jgi:predicted dehydrogenase
MSSPLPFKVALVGYGFVGKAFHAPLIAATPGLLLHTVVSSDPAKVLADHPAVKVAPDLDAALADPEIDLVVIATPDPLHAPQAHAALDAGKARGGRQAVRRHPGRGPRRGRPRPAGPASC